MTTTPTPAPLAWSNVELLLDICPTRAEAAVQMARMAAQPMRVEAILVALAARVTKADADARYSGSDAAWLILGRVERLADNLAYAFRDARGLPIHQVWQMMWPDLDLA